MELPRGNGGADGRRFATSPAAMKGFKPEQFDVPPAVFGAMEPNSRGLPPVVLRIPAGSVEEVAGLMGEFYRRIWAICHCSDGGLTPVCALPPAAMMGFKPEQFEVFRLRFGAMEPEQFGKFRSCVWRISRIS